MRNATSQSLSNSKQGKDTDLKRRAENKIIFLELFKEPQNTKMLHLKTGIPRENLTRRKRYLENAGLLWVMKHDYCPFTGRLVQFLTTNLQTYENWKSQFVNSGK